MAEAIGIFPFASARMHVHNQNSQIEWLLRQPNIIHRTYIAKALMAVFDCRWKTNVALRRLIQYSVKHGNRAYGFAKVLVHFKFWQERTI